MVKLSLMPPSDFVEISEMQGFSEVQYAGAKASGQVLALIDACLSHYA